MKERALKEKADMESLRSQGLGVEEKINNDNNNYVKQVRQKVILSPSVWTLSSRDDLWSRERMSLMTAPVVVITNQLWRNNN